MFLSLIAAALVANPEAAPAEPVLLAAAAPSPVIADPAWVRTPTVEELISAFPVAAVEKGASGEALIECQVRAGGALDGCYVITERGGDYGFGAATVQLAQYFRMAPRSQSGEPTEGAMVRLPMVWKLN
ncbi:MAG: TonB family protein [Caulobacter sp.]|nr:TonB family protein [Caulobacter sp.]